jgi:AcrR family transcriptional regulator
MYQLMKNLQITVNEDIYKKNPEGTDLGKSIIKGGIELIDELGLENFTFKKLALHIGTTESGIYRYFDNKHMLLLYLVNWYWTWLEYQLVFSTHNLSDHTEKLNLAIDILTKPVESSGAFDHINEAVLYRIVTAESYKAYLTKEVDKQNVEGFFSGYKRIIGRICELILGVNNNFQYPNTLATTLIEGSSLQKYFAIHFPSLTDIGKDEKQIGTFFKALIISMIKQ